MFYYNDKEISSWTRTSLGQVLYKQRVRMLFSSNCVLLKYKVEIV